MRTSKPVGNKILARLPDQDFLRISGMMERVSPEVGEDISLPGEVSTWAHFPVSAVLSSLVILQNGETVEASTVGNEGMDGLYVPAQPGSNPYRVNVQVKGDLLRMPAAAFKRALAESPALSQLIYKYALVLIQRG